MAPWLPATQVAHIRVIRAKGEVMAFSAHCLAFLPSLWHRQGHGHKAGKVQLADRAPKSQAASEQHS